jgi:cell division protein FtsX
MPIGTIIGFFTGAFIIGLLLAGMNSKVDNLTQPIEVQLLKQKLWMLGMSMAIISALALAGTFIEMSLT